MTTKPALQRILNGLLHIEEETRVSRKMEKRINPFEKADQ
jgi:hypothetical protein